MQTNPGVPASVSHTGSCVSCRMHWSHALNYKRLPQSSLSLHAAAFSKVTSSSSSGLVQEEIAQLRQRWCRCWEHIQGFSSTLHPSVSPFTHKSLLKSSCIREISPKWQVFSKHFQGGGFEEEEMLPSHCVSSPCACRSSAHCHVASVTNGAARDRADLHSAHILIQWLFTEPCCPSLAYG